MEHKALLLGAVRNDADRSHNGFFAVRGTKRALHRSSSSTSWSQDGSAPLMFSTVTRFCVGALYGRAGRVTALNGGFRPGQFFEKSNDNKGAF